MAETPEVINSYQIVGYYDEEEQEYSWYDVFVDGDCINLGDCIYTQEDAITFLKEYELERLKND